MRNKAVTWYCTICSIALVILVVIPGCSREGYKTFTADNRLCHFSIEYPRVYSGRDGPDLYTQSYFVTFSMPAKGYQMVNPDPDAEDGETVTVYHTPALIAISIHRSNKGFIAKTLIENYLVTEARWANYDLLERSTIPISGLSTEYAHFVSSSLLPMRPAPGEEIPLKHYRWVYFDYDGLIWQIEFKYEGEMAEQAKADFEHVIQTFKILD